MTAATGEFRFTPSTDFTGLYTFVYRVNDGVTGSNSAACWILVEAASDGDGLPDAWEQACFTNLSYGPGDDPDTDRFPRRRLRPLCPQRVCVPMPGSSDALLQRCD